MKTAQEWLSHFAAPLPNRKLKAGKLAFVNESDISTIQADARAGMVEAKLLDESQERERVLKEALEFLRDAQNGPPLIRENEFWAKAMAMTETALAATGKEEK